MPSKAATRRAKGDMEEGYAPTTAAGEFVKEEMHHRQSGKHGPESRKQAIAVGLSQARRAGIPIHDRPTEKGRDTKKKARSAR